MKPFPYPIHILWFVGLLILSACGNAASSEFVSTDVCPSGFPKTGETFGVTICTQSGVGAQYATHALNVMKRLMDYDKDGTADNVAVANKLQNAKAFYLVIKPNVNPPEVGNQSFTEVNTAEMVLTVSINANGTLTNSSTSISGPSAPWDPTIEEALHLITSEGYAKVYPTVFGEHTGSTITNHMDTARGISATTQRSGSPSRYTYPAGAYFTYDDASCNYACMITEFTYWAVTTLRCHQTARAALPEVAREWKKATHAGLSTQNVALVNLLKTASYGFHIPTSCP